MPPPSLRERLSGYKNTAKDSLVGHRWRGEKDGRVELVNEPLVEHLFKIKSETMDRPTKPKSKQINKRKKS